VELVAMTIDMKLQVPMSEQHMMLIFAQTRADQDLLDDRPRSDGAEEHLELSFHEFQEWLVRVCYFQLVAHGAKAQQPLASLLKRTLKPNSLRGLQGASAESSDRSGSAFIPAYTSDPPLALTEKGTTEPEATEDHVHLHELVKHQKNMFAVDQLPAGLVYSFAAAGDAAHFGDFEVRLDAWLQGVVLPAMRPALARRASERDLAKVLAHKPAEAEMESALALD
jgi:hypothetical protein